MGNSVFPIGSRVRVTSYTPFRGLKGTVRTVYTMDAELEDPFCFYLIALEGATMAEPIWFVSDEVELIGFPSMALTPRAECTSVHLSH